MRKVIYSVLMVVVLAAFAPIASAHQDKGNGDRGGDRARVRGFFSLGGFGFDKHRGDSERKNRGFSGTVDAVSSTGFSFTTADDNAYTVTVADAELKKPFGGAIALSDIEVNDKVVVIGALSGDTITATKVIVMPANTHPAIIPKGTVTAVSGNTVTVQTQHLGVVSEVTVKTDGDTQVTKADGSAGTEADVAVGSKITVKGLWHEVLNVLNAIKIKIRA